MAVLTLTFGTLTKSRTISSGDVTRVANAIKADIGLIPDGAGGTRPPTNAEAFDIFADAFFASIVAKAQKSEGDAGAKTVRDAVAPIPLT